MLFRAQQLQNVTPLKWGDVPQCSVTLLTSPLPARVLGFILMGLKVDSS